MKKLLCITVFLGLAVHALAQDTICFVNGSRKIAHVIKTRPNMIYRDTGRFSKDILVPKNMVRYVLYSGGNYEVVSLKNINPTEINYSFTKGSEDAEKNYRHPGGSIGTGITSFATGGILGLIPAVFCSATRPKGENLGLPKGAPVSDKSYMLGYYSKAKKMKQRRVWKGYFIGVSAAIAFLLVTQ